MSIESQKLQEVYKKYDIPEKIKERNDPELNIFKDSEVLFQLIEIADQIIHTTGDEKLKKDLETLKIRIDKANSIINLSDEVTIDEIDKDSNVIIKYIILVNRSIQNIGIDINNLPKVKSNFNEEKIQELKTIDIKTADPEDVIQKVVLLFDNNEIFEKDVFNTNEGFSKMNINVNGKDIIIVRFNDYLVTNSEQGTVFEVLKGIEDVKSNCKKNSKSIYILSKEGLSFANLSSKSKFTNEIKNDEIYLRSYKQKQDTRARLGTIKAAIIANYDGFNEGKESGKEYASTFSDMQNKAELTGLVEYFSNGNNGEESSTFNKEIVNKAKMIFLAGKTQSCEENDEISKVLNGQLLKRDEEIKELFKRCDLLLANSKESGRQNRITKIISSVLAVVGSFAAFEYFITEKKVQNLKLQMNAKSLKDKQSMDQLRTKYIAELKTSESNLEKALAKNTQKTGEIERFSNEYQKKIDELQLALNSVKAELSKQMQSDNGKFDAKNIVETAVVVKTSKADITKNNDVDYKKNLKDELSKLDINKYGKLFETYKSMLSKQHMKSVSNWNEKYEKYKNHLGVNQEGLQKLIDIYEIINSSKFSKDVKQKEFLFFVELGRVIDNFKGSSFEEALNNLNTNNEQDKVLRNQLYFMYGLFKNIIDEYSVIKSNNREDVQKISSDHLIELVIELKNNLKNNLKTI